MLETKLVVKCLAYKIRLSYTPSSIDGTKLRLFFFEKTQQLALFFFTSYNHMQ